MRWRCSAIQQLDWLTARPIAHRGLHDHARRIAENSATAFAAAIAQNYAIECDLQINREGEAVVFHDETLNRMTGIRGALYTRTVEALKRIRLLGSADRIQTLGELLSQVQGKVPLYIELKSHWNGDISLAQRALGVLATYSGPYALMSFDPDLVEAVRLLSPNTVRGIVADRVTGRCYAALPFARRLALRRMEHIGRSHPHFVSYYFRDLPFAPVSAHRATGHPVISWTIRSEAEAIQARHYSDQITFEGFAPA